MYIGVAVAWWFSSRYRLNGSAEDALQFVKLVCCATEVAALSISSLLRMKMSLRNKRIQRTIDETSTAQCTNGADELAMRT